MAEEVKVAPPFEPFMVKRNDIELKFEGIPVKRGKDKTKPTFYPGVKVNSENIGDVVKWLDNDHLISMIRGKMNQRFQGLFKEATTEADGKTPKPFDVDEFRALAEQFSARGETMAEINDEISELNDELANAATSGTLTMEIATRIAMRIKSLVLARENKRRDRDTGEEAETVQAKAA